MHSPQTWTISRTSHPVEEREKRGKVGQMRIVGSRLMVQRHRPKEGYEGKPVNAPGTTVTAFVFFELIAVFGPT